jgi:DNA-binding XRE family transcriptional regulator
MAEGIVMIAFVKNPRIEMKGDIPEAFLEIACDYFGRDGIEVRQDDDLVNISDTSWSRRRASMRNPGLNMKNFRELRGITQATLAGKLGILRMHISAMENGKRAISKAMALRLAELFETSSDRFI